MRPPFAVDLLTCCPNKWLADNIAPAAPAAPKALSASRRDTPPASEPRFFMVILRFTEFISIERNGASGVARSPWQEFSLWATSGHAALQREENLCYDSWARRAATTMIEEAPTIEEAPIIEEDAHYGSDQTQHNCHGRRGDSDGRNAAAVCSAAWAGGSCHVFLRKRPRSHPL